MRVYVGKEIYQLFDEFERITKIPKNKALRFALQENFFKEYLKTAIQDLKEFADEYEQYKK